MLIETVEIHTIRTKLTGVLTFNIEPICQVEPETFVIKDIGYGISFEYDIGIKASEFKVSPYSIFNCKCA